MKIGLLIDSGQLAKWQAKALAALPADWEFAVYNCTNSRSRRRLFKHGLYYVLNLFALRNALTRRRKLPASMGVASKFDFEAEYEGAWQRLPAAVLKRIAEDAPDIIVKFGMGLLRIPEPADLPKPILSYHHGDPRRFRGRPAGFYELLFGAEAVGQVVQLLSNRLDAGKVLAYAETKAHSHSYRRTMAEAYCRSALLLPRAVENAITGRTLPIGAEGKVCKLPSNWTVVRFCSGRWFQLLRRLAYGAFFEKAWQVAEAPRGKGDPASVVDEFPETKSWRLLPQPRGYRFLADPFYHPSTDGFLVEALRNKTARGEILHIWPRGSQRLSRGHNHYSYPGTCTVEGRDYVLPEISEWTGPKLYQLTSEGLEEIEQLRIAGSPRLVDPTLHSCSAGFFLFANVAAEGGSVLRLWHSIRLTGPFTEHPSSPIRISPAGGRMAGLLLPSRKHVYRIGQDLRGSYGHGVLLFRIDNLSTTGYEETEIGGIRFGGLKGPHTLNFKDHAILFDFYRERFSLLAGARRLLGRVPRLRHSNG